MFQPVIVDLPSLLCHQILKRTGNTLIKNSFRYTSTRRLGCARHLLKGHHKGDFTLKQIPIHGLGFISTGLLTENSITPVTIKRYKQTDSVEDPPGGAPGNNKNASPESNANDKSSKIIKKTIKTKPSEYYSNFTKNNLIATQVALSRYLLEQEDIDKLPKYMTRSAFHGSDKMMTMVKELHVEQKAIEKHGSLENLEKKLASRYQVKMFGLESSPLDHRLKFRRAVFNHPMQEIEKKESYSDFLKTKTSSVVLCAILVNGFNMFIKLLAWHFTSSDSILAEAIHSGADTLNQVFLLYALWQSNKQADLEHPYGYKNIKHISSLGGGMIFFLVGSTICILEAWHAFQNPELLTLGATALATMGVSFVTELFSLIYAWKEANRSAKEKNISWLDYVRRGDDPNVSLVFLEDVASVLGVVIATSCMLLASHFQSSYIDALGSVLIGGILAYVSLVIVRSNYHALIGQSIPEHKQEEITSELERDRVIRSVHDVKATQTAGDIRFKAEVDFDGREITLSYLRSIDTEILLKEMQNVKTADDVEKIMLEHGNDIIGQTGLEIDRIEKKLKTKHPDLRHVDLEIL